MNTFIYTLSDPITNEIRYVGKSNYPNKRLFDHMRHCELTNTHKNNWIKKLLSESLKPILKIIDEVPKDNWQFWEVYWIDKLKGEGHLLTNIDKGGNGTTDHNYNTKEKMKIRHKEFPKYNLGKGNSRIHINKDELYQKYITENLSIPKCSKFFNVSEKVIFTNLKEYNIQKDKSIWKKQLSTVEKIDINQYDIDGNFIKEWHGATNIQKELGIRSSDILMCCNGRTNISHGYIWRLKGDNIIHRQEDKSKLKKPVLQMDRDGNILNKYDSLFKASKLTGISRTQIGYCCKGVVCKSAGGFIWKYQNDKAT